MNCFRILVIDDEPDIRKVVERSLARDPQFTVQSCASGEEALALAAVWLPDLILLDVMMPTMDGPATLARLRENPITIQVPVVFLTAKARPQELDFFKSLGAKGAIAKPFDPKSLRHSVRGYLVAARTQANGDSKPPHQLEIVADSKDETQETGTALSRDSTFDNEAFDGLVAILESDHVHELLDTLAELIRGFDWDHVNTERRVELARRVHKLASSAGMLGFKLLSRDCAKLEAKLDAGEEVAVALDAVRHACGTALAEISFRLAAYKLLKSA
jgi:CheY-like chemotaxis protein/HPt (histidine-containing phosphotransfer) domain-containing protein